MSWSSDKGLAQLGIFWGLGTSKSLTKHRHEMVFNPIKSIKDVRKS